MQKQLRPYRRRIVLEAALHAAAAGIAVGLGVLGAFMTVCHLFFDAPSLERCLLVLLGAGLLAGLLLYAVHYRPTQKYVAARIDALGLGERLGTMLAFRHVSTELMRLQEQDALAHLAQLSPRDIAISFPKKKLLLVAALALVVLAMTPAPYLHITLQLPGGDIAAEEELSAESRRIQEMLELLRAQIDASDLSDEEKRALMEQLSAMEAEFDGSMASLAALAEMTQSYEDLASKLTGGMNTGASLAATLMQMGGSLATLGEGIFDQDPNLVRRAFAEMEETLLEDVRRNNEKGELLSLEQNLDMAITVAAEQEADRYLIDILDPFTEQLHELYEQSLAKLDIEASLHTALYRTQEYICISFYSAVTREMVAQAFAAGERQNIAEEGGSGAEGEEEGGGSGYSSMLYRQGAQGVSIGGGEDMRENIVATERMYEPTLDTTLDGSYVPGADDRRSVSVMDNSGHIPYGDVYGLYYARMLEELLEQQLPEDMLRVIENYFYGM